MPPGTAKSGAIAANETWGDDVNPSPIRLTGTVTVNSGVIVRVLPGTEVIAEGAFKLDVIGTMYAGGRRRGRIVFRSDNGVRGAWTGVEINHVGAAESRFEFCDFIDASIGVNVILETVTPLTFTHQFVECLFGNCEIGFRTQSRSFGLSKCVAERNREGLVFSSVSSTSLDSLGLASGRNGLWDTRIRGNDFGLVARTTGILTFSNAGNRIYGNRVGADIQAGVTLTCENAWWGSDTGPTHSSVAGGTGDVIQGGGVIDATPWTELGLYARPDDVRAFCDALLRETGTSAAPSLELALSDDDLERIIERAQGLIDSFVTDERLEKPLFARGTQTNEEVDAEDRPASAVYRPSVIYRPPVVYRTRYRPVRAVTTVERRDAIATWTALTNDEAGGWWSSEQMLRDGLILIAVPPTFSRSSFRFTYTHGYNDVPEQVKAATVRAAAIDVLHAILPPGAADAYAARAAALREDLAAFERRNRGSKVGWSF